MARAAPFRAGAGALAREPGGGARGARSPAASRPARSTSRAASGWATSSPRSFGELARASTTSRSRCTRRSPGFMGHAERGKKLNMAVGHARPLGRDREGRGRRARSSSTPASCSGARREEAIDAVCEQLGELRERLEGEGPRRAVRDRGDGPRARARLGRRRGRDLAAAGLGAAGARLRPHARDLRRRLHLGRAVRRGARGASTPCSRAGAPFHIHFSDIQFANRNETKHLPYGEGTLRAEPLAAALARVRAAGDGDLRVARRRPRPRRSGAILGA